MGRIANGGKPFRFILNRSQAVTTNLFLALYPKEALACLLQNKPEMVEEVFCLLNLIEMSDLRTKDAFTGVACTRSSRTNWHASQQARSRNSCPHHSIHPRDNSRLSWREERRDTILEVRAVPAHSIPHQVQYSHGPV